ncbi:MAG: hypothetical protein SGPRY_011144 [Prymnesium sp.]
MEDALTVSPFKWALVGFMVFYMFLDGIQLTHPMSYLPDYFEDNGLSQTYVGANTFCLYLGNSKSGAAIGGMEGARTFGFLIAPLYGSSLFTAGDSTLRLPYIILGCAIFAFYAALQLLILKGKSELEFRALVVESPEPWLLIKRPPTIAVMVAVVINFMPVAAIEPALEPYLTAPPFNLTVNQVGLTFFILSITDFIGAGVATPVASVLGHVPMLYLTVFLLLLSTFLLSLGPETWVAVILSFIPQSLGCIPAFVIAPAIMMRICRSYGLDPKAYSETFITIINGATGVYTGIVALISGAAVDALGFRKWFFISACIMCVSPLVILWGFNPKVMGVPLAPAADADVDAEQHAKRLEKLAAQKEKK